MTPSPEQQAAIDSTSPRLLLRSSAGAGKTAVMVRRIQATIARGADPKRMVAISFTTQAGRELAERLERLGVPPLLHTGTLHALCLKESSKWPSWGRARPTVIDEQAQTALIKAELERLRLDKRVSVLDVASTLAAGQVSGNKPLLSNPAFPVANAVRRTMLFAKQASMDLLLGEATMFLANYLFPGAEYDEQPLDALFWDEWQDSSTGDFAILNKLEPYTKEVTVVGDICQSIFSFRGSSPEYFRHLEAHADWEKLVLRDNYRSLPPVITAANNLTRGQPGAIEMQATRQDPEAKPVNVQEFNLESSELNFIREWLVWKQERRQDGTRPTCAILCRHNALADRLRTALADMLPPAPKHDLDPDMIRQAMKAVQTPQGVIEDWNREFHACLPYIHHFTELCGNYHPDHMLPAMAEALAQAEQRAAYDYGGLYIGSVHGAKGLEWDHVWIAGAEQASWPATAEARRLFYVAITRARDSLTISAAKSRPALHGKGWQESQMCAFVGDL